MTIFKIAAEHVRESAFPEIRAFCRGKKIRCTSVKMDELFTNFVRVRVSCETKRDANKVRDYIWKEINGGAYCSVERA